MDKNDLVFIGMSCWAFGMGWISREIGFGLPEGVILFTLTGIITFSLLNYANSKR